MSDPEAELRRALSLFRAGRLAEADRVTAGVLARYPRQADAAALRGVIALECGDYERSIDFHRQAIRSNRRAPRYLCHLATTLISQSRFAEALDTYENALKLDADDPDALAGKADVLERQGKAESARAVLEPAIRRGNAAPKIVGAYARAEQRLGNHETVIAFVNEQLARPELTGLLRRGLLLVQGKSYEKQGDYDRAFAAFTAGNRIAAVPFDLAAAQRKVEMLTGTFTRARRAKAPRATHGDRRPVFIVGMPRSGSTLIEQIIHAHPEGHGAGELPLLAETIRSMQTVVGRPYPVCMPELTVDHANELARRYLDALGRHAPSAERITDKSLENYERLGLIALLFPDAAVIHARRDPVELCLSCFMQNLPPHRHPYAADLRDLGRYHRVYTGLMDHWRSIGTRPILDVHYERLVTDQEAESRRIIDFIGLDWDDRCLRFHEARRDVATISHDQVSRPMYTSAVARSEHYGPHLDPLREALESSDDPG